MRTFSLAAARPEPASFVWVRRVAITLAAIHLVFSAVAVISAYDPRLFRYVPSVTITPALLSRFAPGPATIRLTGFGGQKLLQTPAPRVRELAVTVAR